MAIYNAFDTSKYTQTRGNDIANNVYNGLSNLISGVGSFGGNIQAKREANGKPVNDRLKGYFNNINSNSSGQFNLDALFKKSTSQPTAAGAATSAATSTPDVTTAAASGTTAADAATAASGAADAATSASTAGTTGAAGTTAAGNAGNGMAWGSIGNAIDRTWTFQNNLMGDFYTKGRNSFDSDIINTAYGKTTDDPFFGGIGRERNAKRLANDIKGETFYSTANNASDLQADIANSDIFHSEVEGPSKGQRAAGVVVGMHSGAAKGAKIGSNFGPMGTAIGAIAGGVGGLVSKLFGNRRAKRRQRRLNEAIRFNNMAKDQQVSDSATNMTTMDTNRLMSNVSAYGGTQNVISRFRRAGHYFADGGSMSNSDGKISQSKTRYPGVTEFNAGGSHEENPNGGIPQGIDQEGRPNLVEQGEVKLSDITGDGNQYILSARIVVTPEKAQQFGIDPKLVGLSYAEAFKKAYSPYKERQGSHDARNEMAHLISIFQQAQDAEKAEREAAQKIAVISSLSPEQRDMVVDMASRESEAQQQQAMQQQTAMQQQSSMQQGMDGQGMPGQQGMPMVQGQQMIGQQPGMMACGGRVKTSRRKASNSFSEGGDIDIAEAKAMHDRVMSDMNVSSLRRRSALDKAPMWAGIYAWLRQKDYLQDADRYNRITRDGLGRSMVSPERLGGYYTPRYVDPNFDNASLRSMSAQSLNNAAMLAGGNRGAAAAAQSIIFNNAARARGEQLYKAQQFNEDLRMKASQMNNGIDSQNAQNRLQADLQNAARIAAAYDKMEQTEASVNQYNKAMKLNLFQNAANLIGKYGVDNRNRLTTAAMAANSLYGKGSENLYKDING